MRAVPLTDKQRKAMMPYRQNVAGLYRTLDWLRDSILNENREEFRSALEDLRGQLAVLDALVPQNAETASESKLTSSEWGRGYEKLSEADKDAALEDLRDWMEQGLRSPVLRPAFLDFGSDHFNFSNHIFGWNRLPEFCWISMGMLDCFATALFSSPDFQPPPIRLVLRCRLGEESGKLCLFLAAMLSSGGQIRPLQMTALLEVWVGSHLRLLAKAKGIDLDNIYWNRSGAHLFFFFDYPGKLVRARIPGLGELGDDGKARWPECDLALDQIDTAMPERAKQTIRLIDWDSDHPVH